MFISPLNLSPEAIAEIGVAINRGLFPECVMEILAPMRDRLFEVAKVKTTDALPSLRAVMDRSLKGESFENFKKDFAAATLSNWGPPKGTDRAAEMLFHTYTSIAYALRHYVQMRLMEFNPYWRYVCGESQCGHKSLDGLVVPASDPWWDTHYPPNGFNCDCYVASLLEGQVQRKAIKSAKKRPVLDFSPEWKYVCTGERTTLLVP